MLETEPPFLRTISPVCISTLPSILTTPEPFGVSAILPSDVETRPLPFTSKSPPSCGVVSSTTLDIAPVVARPATNVLRVIFFKAPSVASTANRVSVPATEDISDKAVTAVGL